MFTLGELRNVTGIGVEIDLRSYKTGEVLGFGTNSWNKKTDLTHNYDKFYVALLNAMHPNFLWIEILY